MCTKLPEIPLGMVYSFTANTLVFVSVQIRMIFTLQKDIVSGMINAS